MWFWPNVNSGKCKFWKISFGGKCHFRQVFILADVISSKCSFWQMYFQASVHSGRCTFKQVYILADVLSSKCSFWQMYFQASIHSGRCVFKQAFILADVLSSKCDLWQMLLLENKHFGKYFSWFSGKRFSARCKDFLNSDPQCAVNFRGVLAFHLVVYPILTLVTEQITATELMFVIPNFVADLIYSWWLFRLIIRLVWFLEFAVENRLLAWFPAILFSALLTVDFCLDLVRGKVFHFLSPTLKKNLYVNTCIHIPSAQNSSLVSSAN